MGFFFRVCKLPTVYDIHFFICFQSGTKCKGYYKLSCKSSVTAKLNCDILISYNLINMKGYAVFDLSLS